VDLEHLYRDMARVLDRQTMPPLLEDFVPFRGAIDEVWEQLTKIDDQTFVADTPWHAAIVSMDLMAMLASNESLDESKTHITDTSQLDFLPAMHYAFRGEGNYTYPTCPSFRRPYNDKRRGELEKAINNFAAMLKIASDLCFANDGGPQNFDINLFVGAAQHYLGNTPLMDWTTDPCVAVGFGADYDPKDKLSVVYALPTFRAVQHNATFYLPPPFVERLYLQRGFFIETPDSKADAALQDACISIRFKEDKRFRVIRREKEIVNLMKPLAALDDLANHAKSEAAKGVQFTFGVSDVEQMKKTLLKEWDRIGGIPDFLQPSEGENHAEAWRKYMIEMIERLTHLRTAQGLSVNKFILQPVVCSNKQMMTALQTWLEIQEKWAIDKAKREDAARGWGDLAKLLKELLIKCE
jgi:FRG domain